MSHGPGFLGPVRFIERKTIVYDSVFGWPPMLTFLSHDIPRRFGDRDANVTVDAYIYSLIEPVVDKIEAAKTDGAVGEVRCVGDTVGRGHTDSLIAPYSQSFKGKSL
jgi:hypothetical protein